MRLLRMKCILALLCGGPSTHRYMKDFWFIAKKDWTDSKGETVDTLPASVAAGPFWTVTDEVVLCAHVFCVTPKQHGSSQGTNEQMPMERTGAKGE